MVAYHVITVVIMAWMWWTVVLAARTNRRVGKARLSSGGQVRDLRGTAVDGGVDDRRAPRRARETRAGRAGSVRRRVP